MTIVGSFPLQWQLGFINVWQILIIARTLYISSRRRAKLQPIALLWLLFKNHPSLATFQKKQPEEGDGLELCSKSRKGCFCFCCWCVLRFFLFCGLPYCSYFPHFFPLQKGPRAHCSELLISQIKGRKLIFTPSFDI